MKKVKSINISKYNQPRVVLAYCTYNDFNPKALIQSMKQNYNNFKTVILDDSSNPQIKNEIDVFSKKYPNIDVIRRENHVGFKAGNINNYFLNNSNWDYFVILDSDEVIPPNFIVDSLKYFSYFKKIGVVQANHKSINEKNDFQRFFGTTILSGCTTSLTAKNLSGVVTLFGHGAMISKECYDSVNGFPQLVSEDNAFSAYILMKGYYVYFAPDIICGEEFPTNYLAFKKRQTKFTLGNMQLNSDGVLKNIFKSKLNFFFKWDLISHFMLIYLTVILGFFFMAINTLIYFMEQNLFYKNLTILAISLFFIFIPWIKEYIIQFKYNSWIKIFIFILLSTFMIYSLFLITLKAVVLKLFGKKPKFIVTPKENEKITFKMFLRANWFELLLSIIIICLIVWKSIFWIFFLLALGFMSCFIFVVMSNSNKTNKTENEIKFESYSNNLYENQNLSRKLFKNIKRRR
ncbi:glycosyltransferase [Mycoplasma zalophidermidis]|uniref:Glycosyltransferase n=1 Tax=Mycoplasma zalophidermidis TaxID=398174 RepID=A0ABS6DRZ6_9MOLU|nr:glycosyltransferase family 2 protein [Mycoplasma zalophidermidis]MBU4693761.1 glycosyltransferase [Mycoplasma zalophidermidis]